MLGRLRSAEQQDPAPVDFDRAQCTDLAADAVRFSRDVEYPGDPLLTSVEDLVLFEDERADLQVPVAGEYAFVGPVVVELLMDADGTGLISYGLQ